MKKTILKRTMATLLASVSLFTAGCGVNKNEYDPPEREGYQIQGGEYAADANFDVPEELLTMKISASGTDSKIIPKNSSFTVRTAEKTTAEILSANLTITPYTAFSVAEVSETEFTVTPTSELDEGKIYRFTVGDVENPVSSFVFQTSEGMGIKSTIPADLSVGVVLNTGVEITFTDTVEGVNFPEYISVSPETKGRFMLYPDGKTVVFIPEESLSPDTVYEVTVKKGIVGGSGGKTDADEKFRFRTGDSFETGNRDGISIHSGLREAVFSPDEYPTVNFSVTNLGGLPLETRDVKVRLYKYKNAEAAKKALFEYENEKFSSEADNKGKYTFSAIGLSKTAELTVTPTETNSNNYSKQLYFSLPKTEAGVYLIEYTVSLRHNGEDYEENYQGIMSVTDLRLYTESASGETLFWVTDKDGEVVSGAEIKASAFERSVHWNSEVGKKYPTEKAVTDGDGVAVIGTGENNAAYVTTAYGGEELLSFVTLADTAKKDGYAGYIYTDREVYFSDDAVNYSGVVSPVGTAALPDKLYVYVGASPYGVVAVDGEGGFYGSIPVEDYGGWGFNVRFCDSDGDIVISKYIRVTQEDKPVYKASISYDRIFYEYGDEGEMTLRATFYDGTPAPGLRFRIYGNDFSQYGSDEVTTDENGEVKVKFKPSVKGLGDRVHSTYPVNVYFSAELMGYETTELTAFASVPFFHSEYQLRTERVSADETEVRLYHTDTSKINTASDINPDSILGKPADGEISVSLIKYTFYKVKTGTTYNPITKTTTENYYYDRKESTEKVFDAKFENGVVKLPHVKVAEGEDATYYYEVKYRDEKNSLSYKMTLWATKTDGREVDWYYEGQRLVTDRESYGVGDKVTMTLLKGEKKYGGKVLYSIYDSFGKLYSRVSDGEFTFEFTDEMVFGVRVYAAAYDNGFSDSSAYVNYDVTNSTAKVEIIPDRESYKPGDTANVKIKVTDKDGDAFSGRVTLGVVDEACFALGEQTLYPAGNYFASLGMRVYPNVNGRFDPFSEMEGEVFCGDIKCLSCARDMVTEDAEMEEAPSDSGNGSYTGNGGEEEIKIRDYFADNPVFSVVTAENGEAVLSFLVPDNITEWRLTAVVTDTGGKSPSERKLGVGKTDVIATLPYFINVSACELYIVGDDVAMSARAYGCDVDKKTETEYRAVLYRGDEKLSEVKAEAYGNGFGWLNFGKLDVGAYSVTVSGESDVGKDALEVRFTVSESAVVVDVEKELSIDEIESIKPILYPVTLSFYNGELQLYRRVLDNIRYSFVPNRADSKAAYYVAETAAAVLYGKSRVNAEKISGDYGLIPLLDYGTESVELSAKILAIAPEAISAQRRENITSQLREKLRGGEFVDEEELTAVLLGLASQNEPILDVLYYVAGGCADYSITAKIYLAAAFAYIGDFSFASNIYSDLKNSFGVTGEGDELSFAGKNTEETIKNTANALMTASRISRKDAEGMVRYLLTHVSDSEYYGLELASYVKFYMPTEAVSSEFTYSFGDGEEEKVTLKAGRTFSLTLTKTGFEAFRIVSCDEDIKLTASYGGSPEELTADGIKSGEFSIDRTVVPYDAESGIYLVTIHFRGRSDRNYERFDLSDTIPTGARFVSILRGGSSEISVSGGKRGYAHIYNESGQKMTGGISIYTPYKEKIHNWNSTCAEYEYEGSVSYLIRGAVRGEFVMESSMMRNCRTGAYALSDRLLVVIDDGEWETTALK